jgi:hypothetical protein
VILDSDSEINPVLIPKNSVKGAIKMDKKSKDKFMELDKEKWDLNEIKFRFKELRKLAKVEVEHVDVFETFMWTS